MPPISLDEPTGRYLSFAEREEIALLTCVREVREELGIEPSIGRLLAVDWAPNPGEGDKVLYLFDGGMLGDQDHVRIQPQAEELQGYGFHDVRALSELTIPRLARRIIAATKARSSGSVAYLEHGRVPGQ